MLKKIIFRFLLGEITSHTSKYEGILRQIVALKEGIDEAINSNQSVLEEVGSRLKDLKRIKEVVDAHKA